MAITLNFQTPTQQTLDALAIVNNPTRYAGMPQLRMLAWATLKTARGQTICQHRLRRQASPADRQVA